MARVIIGTVTSDSADKTVVIIVATRKTHPIYKKQYLVHTKFMAHDEDNQAKIGDRIAIKESRPLSARKRFTLDKIIEKAHGGFKESDATADVPIDETAPQSTKADQLTVAEEKKSLVTNLKSTGKPTKSKEHQE